MKFEDEIMEGWRKWVELLEKQSNCEHKGIIWDATGKVGICVMCGATIRRK